MVWAVDQTLSAAAGCGMNCSTIVLNVELVCAGDSGCSLVTSGLDLLPNVCLMLP